MKMFVVSVCVVGLVGCTPRQTTVDLQNNTPNMVQATVFFDDDQNVLESLIESVGAQQSYTIPAGESRSFSRNCEEIQAVKVKGDLLLLGGLGPSKSTNVFRDGTDFGCGDRLLFSFTSTTIPPALNIDFSVQR